MKRIFFVVVFIPIFVFSQQTKDILFVGNSYIYVNDLPNMVKQIAISFGDTLNYESSTPGGASFGMHATNTTTISKINQQVWDYVVLQAQSQEPSLSTNYVNTNVYPAVQSLIDIIENNSTCIEPMFFMTWGRKYGDASNCAPWPPVCTYLGMQQQLRLRYLDFSFTHDASCSPVGMAWKESISQDSTLNLYSPDNSHPSVYGSYLAACTFYASIFKNSPIGTSYVPNGLDTVTASFLQDIASNTVLDSLSTWNIFNADFSFNVTNDVATFNNLSSNFESVLWDFGDGQISTDENPLHIYAASGNYTVTLTTYTNLNCKEETITYTVNINIPTSVEVINPNRILIQITDILGRKTSFKKNTILYYLFDNGGVEQRIVVE
ncbi:MAG: PKD domain-containing protein [Flavobacteriales bacterium]